MHCTSYLHEGLRSKNESILAGGYSTVSCLFFYRSLTTQFVKIEQIWPFLMKLVKYLHQIYLTMYILIENA